MEKWMVAAKRADFKGIGERFGIDQVTARIIRNRDVIGEKAIEKYLHGSRKDFYSPWLLKDMEKAVAILQEKIENRNRIRIIGDYDIDGVMSTYILLESLRGLGCDVDMMIPNRITDGYGINEHLIEQAWQEGRDTIITCDNGIAAVTQIRKAKDLGMTVIVTDHHEVPFEDLEGGRKEILPPADAIVNPKQKACSYPFAGLCGAVVAMKVMEALYEKMAPEVDLVDKMLPFAGIAIALGAGGHDISRSLVSYIKTFFGFCISGAMMVIAIKCGVSLCTNFVSFDLSSSSDIAKCILITVQMSITPIVIAGLVKGSDAMIARMF